MKIGFVSATFSGTQLSAFRKLQRKDKTQIGISELKGVTGFDTDYILCKSTPDFVEGYRRKNKVRKEIFKGYDLQKAFILESPFFPKAKDEYRLNIGGLMRTDSVFITEPNYEKLAEYRKLYKPIKTSGEFIGLPVQIPLDKSLRTLSPNRMLNYERFLSSKINELFNQYGKKIYLRKHPKMRPRDKFWDLFIRKLDPKKIEVQQKGSLEDFLSKCEFVVTYTSNTAVECYMFGIPVYVECDESWAWPLRMNGNATSLEEQEKWLAILAANQFNIVDFFKSKTYEDYLKAVGK